MGGQISGVYIWNTIIELEGFCEFYPLDKIFPKWDGQKYKSPLGVMSGVAGDENPAQAEVGRGTLENSDDRDRLGHPPGAAPSTKPRCRGEFPDACLLRERVQGSFDSAETSLREVSATLRMTRNVDLIGTLRLRSGQALAVVPYPKPI